MQFVIIENLKNCCIIKLLFTITRRLCYEKFVEKYSRGGGTGLVSFSKRRRGFTLAEVLVTLGIIGVVSAMTVPTLMQNHQRKVYVTQLHKFYNELQQALLRYQTDKNAINLVEAGLTGETPVKDFLYSYFKVIQGCEGVVQPCFASSYRSISGSAKEIPNEWGGYCIVTAGGMSVCLDPPNRFGNYGVVFFDINGPQEPNIMGRDAFYAAIFYDGVIDVVGADIDCRTNGICGTEGGTLKDIRGTVEDCTSGDLGQSCFGQLLNNNWEMTY